MSIIDHLPDGTNEAHLLSPQLINDAGTFDASPPVQETVLPAIQWQETLLFDERWASDLAPDFLPDWARNYILALSKSTQTPVSLALFVVLAALAAAMQKKFEITPTGDDYKEPVNIWTCTVKPPATGKSPVFNAATKPIVEWEREQALLLKTDIDQQNARNEITDKRIEEMKKVAVKAETELERDQIIHDIARLQSEKKFDIKAPRVWTASATPESLESLLHEHGEKIAVLSPEGGIFEIMTGLYSNGRANIDVFLKSHSGDPHRVDRAERTAVLIRPALTFGLAIQPGILEDLGSGGRQRLRQNGCLARFFYDMSAPNVGTRRVSNRQGMPAEIELRYCAWLKKLLAIPVEIDETGATKSGVIQLSKEARALWIQFSDWLESQQGEGKPLENIQDWAGKLAGQSLRLAAIAHIAEHFQNAANVEIHEKQMAKVLDFCQTLIPHAQLAFELMCHSGRNFQDAKFAFNWLIENADKNDQGEIVLRQQGLHSTSRFKNDKLERLTKALEILQERNILAGPAKVQTTGPNGGKGRPSIVWYVNPAIFADEVVG